ncbi:MAG: hypothetical protein KBS96_03990 [Lachnospiraceae bacterium]|nr:hypothetical protein [Candidatus Colinaster scatohippi]
MKMNVKKDLTWEFQNTKLMEIKRFSIPCVISMVVAALYNIVDQIFIGWSEAGAYGNVATNIVYPFTVLALGLALLVGGNLSKG